METTKVPKVVVVGSLVYDLVARVDRRPVKGETRLGTDFGMFPGGKGANQAVQAAKMGAKVWMVGRVGADFFGQELIQSLQGHGVDTEYVTVDLSTTTAVGCITVDETGDNSIVVVPQANMKVTIKDVDDAEWIISQADVLLLQLEIPLDVVAHAAKLASRLGCRVVLNPAPATKVRADLLQYVDVLTPNESELGALLGKDLTELGEFTSAARELLLCGPDAVIVTLGDKGALLVTPEIETLVPAFLVEAVDTTAAGDAFTGTLAVCLAEDRSLLEAIIFANAAGGLAATRRGAQPSLADRQEIQELSEERIK
jgi:ribokinase